jgi:SAM-dependent methyltransferase
MSRERSRAWQVLDRPVVWETSRVVLDVGFGLYRKRKRLIREWGLLGACDAMLDIGCGTGRYSKVGHGDYLGIDLEPKYIDWASRHRAAPGRTFRSADVATLAEEQRSFDLVLLVDVLHHLDDQTCGGLLSQIARVTRRHVLSLEPVREQRNSVGQWIIDNDRGDHMRPLAGLHALFAASPLEIVREQDLMLGPIRTRATLAVPHNES